MYSVSQHEHDQSRSHHTRDRSRRQYDIPSMRSPKALSPEINEVLHMLKAFETDTPDNKSDH